MKNIITILLMSLTTIAFSQETYTFDGEITNFRNFDGKVLLQVFNEKKEVVKKIVIDFKGKKCTFTIADLPKGTYGFQYFHDENGDKKLNSNFMSIPTEGYGFSNNATAYFGPPDFKEWLFELNEDKVLNLKISYLL